MTTRKIARRINAVAWFYGQPGFHQSEVVIHKNGDPRDNRVSNLERVQSGEAEGVRCLDCGSLTQLGEPCPSCGLGDDK